MPSSMQTFIAGLPKVELHLHVEGALAPAQKLAFAHRNGIALPYASAEEMAAAQHDFATLEDFLAFFYASLDGLRNERDVYEATRSVLETCAVENIIYVELSFDPQAFTGRGGSFDELIGGMSRAQGEAETDFGVKSNLIMCFMRELSTDSAFETLEQAAPHRDKIAGVGLDSVEEGNPPSKFTEVFRLAKVQGYRRTAHCDVDQTNSLAHIRQCLELLDVERIDHGVNAVEDDAVMAELKRRGTCITVCPTWRPADSAPRRTRRLKQLYDAGLCVTINSDDPGVLASGWLTNILTEVQTHSNYAKRDLVAFTRNAIAGAWLSEDEKRPLYERLDAYATSADLDG